MNRLLVFALTVQVSSLALAKKGWKRDPIALWRTLAPFADDDMEPGKEGLNADQLKQAMSTKDSYGQPLPIPVLKIMMDQVDANHDGFYSKTEMVDWAGYQGHEYCHNLGDRSYGCSDRCVGGIDKSNGNASYFSYETKKYVINDDSDHESNNHYTGGITRGHQLAVKAAIEELKQEKVAGEYVLLGMKAFYHFRLVFDKLKELGDTTTKIHLYDTFTGFAACDHAKDLSMCPTPGSSAVDQTHLTNYVKEWADSSRVIVHKVDNYDNVDLPSSVAFAFIDGALYKTTKSMLTSAGSKLVSKGTMMIHDFGWEGFTGVEMAAQEFAKEKGWTLKLAGSEFGASCYLGVVDNTATSGGLFR